MEDVFSTDEISEMTRALNFTVVHCLSREEDVRRHARQEYPGVIYEKGRLSEDILRRYGVSGGASVYLCGPPPMMDSALNDLQKVGVDPSTVDREKFSWDKP
jgi:propane monooxygenase reductase subunit